MAKKQLEVGLGQSIAYTIRRHHLSKRLRITVSRGGEILVTMPRRARLQDAVRFVSHQAVWIKKQLEEVTSHKMAGRPANSSAEFKKYKEVARRLVAQKINQFNQIYRFPFCRVAIRNQKSRWGSCSRQGNLNFNYRLALIDSHLADYVVVHELCHLKEQNHSARFWKLVAETIPDFKIRRHALKSKHF